MRVVPGSARQQNTAIVETLQRPLIYSLVASCMGTEHHTTSQNPATQAEITRY